MEFKMGANALDSNALGWAHVGGMEDSDAVLGNVIDHPLDDNHADMDVTGDVGQEFRNEVVNRCEPETCRVTRSAGPKVGFSARDVEIADLVADRKAENVGVVDHALAIIALCPEHLNDGMADAAGD